MEVIGDITVRTRVQYRDRFGRFAALLDRAAVATAKDLTDTAVRLAKANAPVKTGALMAGIVARYAGKVGYVESTAPHAHPVEVGSIAHVIPGAFGREGGVMHPGNVAQPYLEPVDEQLMPLAPAIVRKHYPG